MNDDVYQMYLEELELIVPCSHEENESLLKAYAAGDADAKKQLIEGNLKSALVLVEEYRESGIPLNDLAQEANIALIMAVEELVASKEEISFHDYLKMKMKEALDEAVQMQQLEYNAEEEMVARINVLKEVSCKMAEELGREATIEELAERMKMTIDEIRDIMKMTLDAMSVIGE